MLTIGCHLSSAKGYEAMGKTALSIGANTFQFFTRNPRGGRAKAADPEDAARFRACMAEHGFPVVLAHAPYTVNPCAAEARTRAFAREVLADDLARLEEAVPGQLYNFHPGSHVGPVSYTHLDVYKRQGQRADGQGGQKADAPLAGGVCFFPVEALRFFGSCRQRGHLLCDRICRIARSVYSMRRARVLRRQKSGRLGAGKIAVKGESAWSNCWRKCARGCALTFGDTIRRMRRYSGTCA